MVASLRPGAHILFLCHGNICRSPYAAAALRERLRGTSVGTIDSAGFYGPGRSPPAVAVGAARKRGVDLAAHRSKMASEATLRRADLVVVMDTRQARAATRAIDGQGPPVVRLADLSPRALARREIADPIGQPIDVFEASYGLIDSCLDTLVSALKPSVAVAVRPEGDPVEWHGNS